MFPLITFDDLYVKIYFLSNWVKLDICRLGSVVPAFPRISTWSQRAIQWLWNSIPTQRHPNQASRSALLVSISTSWKNLIIHSYSLFSHWIDRWFPRRQDYWFWTWKKLNGKENKICEIFITCILGIPVIGRMIAKFNIEVNPFSCAKFQWKPTAKLNMNLKKIFDSRWCQNIYQVLCSILSNIIAYMILGLRI